MVMVVRTPSPPSSLPPSLQSPSPPRSSSTSKVTPCKEPVYSKKIDGRCVWGLRIWLLLCIFNVPFMSFSMGIFPLKVTTCSLSWWLDVRPCSKANLMTWMLKSRNPMRRCQIGMDDHCQSLTNMNKEIMEKLERNTIYGTHHRWLWKMRFQSFVEQRVSHGIFTRVLQLQTAWMRLLRFGLNPTRWRLLSSKGRRMTCFRSFKRCPIGHAMDVAFRRTWWTWPLTDPSRRALRLSSASAMSWKMNRRGAELTCGSASWSTPPRVQNNTRRVTRYGMCRINQYVFSWVYWPPCDGRFFNDSLRLNMWSF